MIKFITVAALYLVSLFGFLHLFPDDQPQLLHEFALDQAEFNQSLSELNCLQIIDPSFPIFNNHANSPRPFSQKPNNHLTFPHPANFTPN